MNILLLGYGKMGRFIEQLALQRNHTIVAKIDENNKEERKTLDTGQIDAAIEFSSPEAAADNIRFCLENQIPVVSGTTGWLDKMEEIKACCKQKDGAFFYASNYSIGVNIFFKLNEYLAEMMNRYPEYKVDVEEIHHTEKLDSPSGTAITLAEGIISRNDRKKQWKNEDSSEENVLPIHSFREPNVPGTHTINYKSEIDDLTINHTAHSRKGFAMGAMLVAEWIKDKKGVLDMNDFLSFN